MRPRPDPLQRLALLRHDGRSVVVGVPASPTKDGSTGLDGDLVIEPPNPAPPADESVAGQQDLAPASRGPGRHRQSEQGGAPAQGAIGEMTSSDSDVQGVEAFPVRRGWVPDDDREGAQGEGDDGDSDNGDSDNGDDGDGDGVDSDDGDGDDGDSDDSDSDDGDGDAGDGDDGEAEAVGDGDEPEASRIRARRLGNRPWGRLAELWVPESLRDARIDPGRRGLLVLLLVAAVAAVATAIGVWRDRPEPRPVETVALAPASGVTGPAALAPAANPAGSPASGATPTSGATSTAASTGSPTAILVSVTGLVAHPGVVTLPAGARVADAIAGAGGSTTEADLTGLNLAAKLADGDSVVIAAAAGGGGRSAVSGAGAAPSLSQGIPGSPPGQQSSPLIDLNTADEAALDSLPGVGPVMAQNILAWRAQNGRFNSVDQLQEISGIGPARYAQISALVTVS